MSMPRYTCRESADTISPPIASASRTASAVLPTAVGPTTATRGDTAGVGVTPALWQGSAGDGVFIVIHAEQTPVPIQLDGDDVDAPIARPVDRLDVRLGQGGEPRLLG